MMDPEQEFVYEQKCEQISSQIEMLILDGIIAALGKVKYYLQEDCRQISKPSEDMETF